MDNLFEHIMYISANHRIVVWRLYGDERVLGRIGNLVGESDCNSTVFISCAPSAGCYGHISRIRTATCTHMQCPPKAHGSTIFCECISVGVQNVGKSDYVPDNVCLQSSDYGVHRSCFTA